MGKLKPTDTLTANPEVVFHEEFEDWALLYQPLFDEAMATGPMGVAVWKALDGRHSLAEIAAEFKAECEDTPDSILEDILAFSLDLYRYMFVALAPEGEER